MTTDVAESQVAEVGPSFTPSPQVMCKICSFYLEQKVCRGLGMWWIRGLSVAENGGFIDSFITL